QHRFEHGASSTASVAGSNAVVGGLSLSGFEIVAVLGGSGGSVDASGGANATVIASSQADDPGLVRETTVGMGRFNVVYREAIAEARELAANSTALGSSYHEFLEDDAPRVILLRAVPGGTSADQASPAASTNTNS